MERLLSVLAAEAASPAPGDYPTAGAVVSSRFFLKQFCECPERGRTERSPALVWDAIETGQASSQRQSHFWDCSVGEVLLKVVGSGFSLSLIYATNTEDFPDPKMSQKNESLNFMLTLIYLLV